MTPISALKKYLAKPNDDHQKTNPRQSLSNRGINHTMAGRYPTSGQRDNEKSEDDL